MHGLATTAVRRALAVIEARLGLQFTISTIITAVPIRSRSTLVAGRIRMHIATVAGLSHAIATTQIGNCLAVPDATEIIVLRVIYRDEVAGMASGVFIPSLVSRGIFA